LANGGLRDVELGHEIQVVLAVTVLRPHDGAEQEAALDVDLGVRVGQVGAEVVVAALGSIAMPR
jgi:hypothetical protein